MWETSRGVWWVSAADSPRVVQRETLCDSRRVGRRYARRAGDLTFLSMRCVRARASTV